MEVAMGGNGGKLNPWAEPFVPAGWSSWRCGGGEAAAGVMVVEEEEAEVEDFSPEWWRLVAASPAFRDRWLRDYSALGLLDGGADDAEAFLPDHDDTSFPDPAQEGVEDGKGAVDLAAGGKKVGLEVVAWGIDKWWRAHSSPPEVPRYAEKAPRKVAGGAARVSPRTIQQPR
ncbi:hypothetical protein GUJ93_ZPchr0010g8340 [Zizania palustris]|uniref:Uncharacterized protein n=1 Tax=Zizania palustris TaxID=103762 RepID=A0A8J5W9B2_ZIZPA|nr:hypothetical protein GUJ93_ZPchr0010g8340 [Zizania palustris]